ncbi:MAG: pilin [Nitrospirales bacterium]|nr:MAG: pilin [Nitrospirales bacterium]
MNHIMTFINNEDGATAMEYGLFAALISAVIIGSVTTLGNVIGTTLNTISASMTAAS